MKIVKRSELLSLCMLIFVGLMARGVSAQRSGSNCADLAKLKIDNGSISDAAEMEAGKPYSLASPFGPPVVVTSLPGHCVVHGEVNHHKGADGKDYGDRFEIRMPTEWQGRLLFLGGGGLDGLLNPAIGFQGPTTKPDSKSALGMGYAVVSTDGGHQAVGGMPIDGSFGSDPDARADYNYRSTKLVADAARKIVAVYYEHPIQHSYFSGCSNGGREGLIAGERYAEYFDGIIAGAPAFNLTNAAIAEAWATVQLAAIAPKKPDGSPDLAQSLTEADLKLLVSAVLEKCDALDGLKDGLIFNAQACHFDPAVLKCPAGQSNGCLSEQKAGAIQKIFGGPHDSKGNAIYSAWPYDSGVAADGWRMWITGAGPMPAFNVIIFPQFFNGVVLAGAPPPVDIFKFNFDSDPARIEKASLEINATSTDWSAFRKKKGKLLLYTGMSDPVFSPLDLIRYYKQLEQDNGGEKEAQSFARLFLVPGMNHCSGGPGLDDFDTLSAMRAWVEEGKAPDSLVARGVAFAGRTRPLCAFPLIATYNGKGDSEDAANFTCRKP